MTSNRNIFVGVRPKRLRRLGTGPLIHMETTLGRLQRLTGRWNYQFRTSVTRHLVRIAASAVTDAHCSKDQLMLYPVLLARHFDSIQRHTPLHSQTLRVYALVQERLSLEGLRDTLEDRLGTQLSPHDDTYTLLCRMIRELRARQADANCHWLLKVTGLSDRLSDYEQSLAALNALISSWIMVDRYAHNNIVCQLQAMTALLDPHPPNLPIPEGVDLMTLVRYGDCGPFGWVGPHWRTIMAEPVSRRLAKFAELAEYADAEGDMAQLSVLRAYLITLAADQAVDARSAVPDATLRMLGAPRLPVLVRLLHAFWPSNYFQSATLAKYRSQLTSRQRPLDATSRDTCEL